MKKYMISAILLIGATGVTSTLTKSCTTLATTDVGMSVIKGLLIRGINNATIIYSNKEAFMSNDKLSEALPSELVRINSFLNQISPSLARKQKEYIAEAAAYTVKTSSPILKNAVNNLTKADVARITQGKKGTLTQVLKEKSYHEVVTAIMPKVDEKLNEFGLISKLNSFMRGGQVLGNVFGNNNSPASNKISELASQQIADGLFILIEEYEKNNKKGIIGAL